MAFLEERIDDCFAFGSNLSSISPVDIHADANGNEYRTLRHPYPKLVFSLDFLNKLESWMYGYIVDIYDRSLGRYGGFRLKNPGDYSSNDRILTPAYTDQLCLLVSAGVYQLVVWYDTQGDVSTRHRRIKKPVSGSVIVGIRDDFSNDHPVESETTGGGSETQWAVDTTTGEITFAANKTFSVTDITQAASAVITVGAHTLDVDHSVHISGVNGMAQINGRRATVTAITATTITVNINTTTYGAYTSGGTVNTRPQSNEGVTAGFLFDIPVRFETDLSNLAFVNRSEGEKILSTGIQLIELLNP